MAIREKISRRWAMQELKIQIQDEVSSQESDEWIQECIQRIWQFDKTIVWNPLAIVREEPMPNEVELVEVQKKVSELLVAAGNDKTN